MSKRLHSLRVRNFRQLKELDVPVLGHVNLIVGANNSGKSTLLESLRLFAAKASPTVIEEILLAHGEYQIGQQDAAGEQAPEKSIANLFTGRIFPKNDGEALYIGELPTADQQASQFVSIEHILLREDVEERKVDGESALVRRRTKVPKATSEATDIAEDALEVLVREGGDLFDGAHRANRLSLVDFFGRRRGYARSRVEEAIAPIPHSYVPARLVAVDPLAEAWDDVVLTSGEKLALDALRVIEPETLALAFVQTMRGRAWRASNVRISEPKTSDDRVAVLKLNGMDSPVPLQSMGDGMARMLQLVLSGLRAGGGLLLVDEIENGLHYSVQEQLWKLLFHLSESRGLQIFATTHSSDCVKAFCQVAVNHKLEGYLHRMEKDKNAGVTVSSSIGEASIAALIDSNVEVR